MLITLVENAFKHGFYTNDKIAFVSIVMSITNNSILFEVAFQLALCPFLLFCMEILPLEKNASSLYLRYLGNLVVRKEWRCTT